MPLGSPASTLRAARRRCGSRRSSRRQRAEFARAMANLGAGGSATASRFATVERFTLPHIGAATGAGLGREAAKSSCRRPGRHPSRPRPHAAGAARALRGMRAGPWAAGRQLAPEGRRWGEDAFRKACSGRFRCWRTGQPAVAHRAFAGAAGRCRLAFRADWQGLREAVGGRLIGAFAAGRVRRTAPAACAAFFESLKNPYYLGDEAGADADASAGSMPGPRSPAPTRSPPSAPRTWSPRSTSRASTDCGWS